jgi:hypothetical protein
MCGVQSEAILYNYARPIYILKLYGLATTAEDGWIMIEWLARRIFSWTSLREYIFDEVHLHDYLDSIMSDPESMETASLSWCEGDTWYGWTHDSNAKRYYFDDIGNKSLIGLWEDQFLSKAD